MRIMTTKDMREHEPDMLQISLRSKTFTSVFNEFSQIDEQKNLRAILSNTENNTLILNPSRDVDSLIDSGINSPNAFLITVFHILEKELDVWNACVIRLFQHKDDILRDLEHAALDRIKTLEPTSEMAQEILESSKHALHDVPRLRWIQSYRYDGTDDTCEDEVLIPGSEKKIIDLPEHVLQRNGMALKYFDAETQDDMTLVREAVRENGQALRYASKRLKSNRKIVHEAIHQTHRAYPFVGPDLQNSIGFFMRATCIPKRRLTLFKYAGKTVRHDMECVRDTFDKNGIMLAYAEADHKNDIGLVKRAFRENRESAYYASNRIQTSDPEIALHILSHHPEQFCHLDASRKNRNFVGNLMRINPRAFQYLDEQFRNIMAVVRLAVEHDSNLFEYAGHDLKANAQAVRTFLREHHSIFEHIDENLKCDPNLVNYAIRHQGAHIFKKACKVLRHDPDFIIRVIRTTPHVLDYVKEDSECEELLGDSDFIRAAIHANAYAFTAASEALRCDLSIAELALSTRPANMEVVCDSLKHDTGFVRRMMRVNPNVFEHLPEQFHCDQEVMRIAMSHQASNAMRMCQTLEQDDTFIGECLTRNPRLFQYFSTTIRSNANIALEAVRLRRDNMNFIDESLACDKSFISQVIRIHPSLIKQGGQNVQNDREFLLETYKEIPLIAAHLNKNMLKDREFVLAMVQFNSAFFDDHLPKTIRQDRQIVLEAIKNNGCALAHAAHRVKNDQDVVLEAIKHDGCALRFASDSLKRNKEIVLEAIRQNPEAYQYADKSLKEDKDIKSAFKP